MKNIKLIITLLIFTLSFSSCNNKTNTDTTGVYQCPMKCEGEKTFDTPGNCTVCKMDLKSIPRTSSKEVLSNGISEESIFNLTTKWNTEEGMTIQLKELKGKAAWLK